jgi:hypothetical protein
MGGGEMGSVVQILVNENNYDGRGEGGKRGTIQYSVRNRPVVLLLRCMGRLKQQHRVRAQD